jgi:hypothetical protein
VGTVQRAGVAQPAGAAGRPDWLACLQEMCELLWPPPAVVRLGDSKPARAGLKGGPRRDETAAWLDRREFALIAGIHQPPLLVPADRHAAAGALGHYCHPQVRIKRLGVKALCLGLRGGLGGVALRRRVLVSAPGGADTIEEYLTAVLSRDIQVSMYLGPARANRKPVLQLLVGTGEPAGFAKIGVNPLTCSLVRAEHDSLVRLGRAGLREITIPKVLHYDSWRGLEVLVLSPLPAWQSPRPLPAPRLAAAMAELARVGGLTTEPLSHSRYLGQLRSRLAAADPGAERAALLHALDDLTARAGGETLTFGSWHGDWSPWNMASTGSGLLVWDWERFATGVPLGFDALHHWLQARVAGHHEPAAAARSCAERAPRELAPFGIAARQAQLTAVLYLADLATRYLTDRQAQAGARLGATETWLIPAIAGEVARLRGAPGGQAGL